MKKNNYSSYELIVEAYIKLCATDGAESVTLTKLSKLTGLAVSNIKYHIDNNEMSLKIFARDRIRNHINTYIEDGLYKDRASKQFDPIKSYINHMLRWGYEFHNYACYLLYIYYLTSIEKNKGDYQDILNKALTRIEALFNEGIGLGIYTISKKDKETLIKNIHAITLGQLVIIINLNSKSEMESRISSSCNLIDLLVKKPTKL